LVIAWLKVTVMFDVAETASLFVVGDVDEIVGGAANAAAVDSTNKTMTAVKRSKECIMMNPLYE
jgi:hypothetical protein